MKTAFLYTVYRVRCTYNLLIPINVNVVHTSWRPDVHYVASSTQIFSPISSHFNDLICGVFHVTSL